MTKTRLPENVDENLSQLYTGVYPCGDFNPFAFNTFRAALVLARASNRGADFTNFRRWENEARVLYNDIKQPSQNARQS